jgi:hypothetical protein
MCSSKRGPLALLVVTLPAQYSEFAQGPGASEAFRQGPSQLETK